MKMAILERAHIERNENDIVSVLNNSLFPDGPNGVTGRSYREMAEKPYLRLEAEQGQRENEFGYFKPFGVFGPKYVALRTPKGTYLFPEKDVKKALSGSPRKVLGMYGFREVRLTGEQKRRYADNLRERRKLMYEIIIEG